MTIKICLISPRPPPYGGISHWTELILNNSDYFKGLVFFNVDTAPRWKKIEDINKIRRILGGLFQLIKEYYHFIKVVKQKPDLIHLTTSGSLAIFRDYIFCSSAKFLNIPFIYHLRFGRVPEISLINSFEWKLLGLVIDYSDLIIAIDSYSLKIIEGKYPNKSIIYVPNPIDLSSFEINKNIKTKTVLFLGWKLISKGIEELLLSWSIIDTSDWKLIIAGPGNDNLIKENKFYQKEKTEIIGELSHEKAMELMANSSIFVLPSHTEGFPNVILEAMAFGKPIIATKVGAIPDMLSGECGLLIEPKNTRELSLALQKLLNNDDLAKKIGENAFRKVRDNFSKEKIFNVYLENWTNLHNLSNMR